MSFNRGKNYSESSPLLDNRTDILIKENQSLVNSQRMVEEAIGTGIAVNERLIRQMETLGHSNNIFSDIATKVPLIGKLTGQIQIKRKRDRMILGSLIGFLMFFCVWYLFG